MNSTSLFRKSTPPGTLAAGTVLVSLTVTPLTAQQAASADPDVGAIDRFAESERQDMRIPGVAIGVVRGDQMLHLASFGRAFRLGQSRVGDFAYVLAGSAAVAVVVVLATRRRAAGCRSAHRPATRKPRLDADHRSLRSSTRPGTAVG